MVAGNQKPKKITGALEKNNKQPISTVQHKRAKNNIKPVIFTTQYNPLGPNISFIIKKDLPIIKDNTNLIEMFPKDSIFCACKRFPNLRDLMVQTDPYSIKPLKTGVHLGFSEGRGPNFAKEANQYKTKKKTNISHILVITF